MKNLSIIAICLLIGAILGFLAAAHFYNTPPESWETSAVVAGYEQDAARNAEIIADKTDSIKELLGKVVISESTIPKTEAKIAIAKNTYAEIKQDFAAANNHKCDSLTAAADSIIDLQAAEIDTLKKQVDYLKSVVLLQSGIIDIQREQFTAAERVINQLEASNRRTWWERNGKWVTLAGGLIIGSAGTAAVMR
ncbi:MAG: hypothetical protein LBN27_02115 [Prevotellaceae bacterium]|jgi:hypothetical protein|nr:hypothetical protein [Prevotellaceae bacterium]